MLLPRESPASAALVGLIFVQFTLAMMPTNRLYMHAAATDGWTLCFSLLFALRYIRLAINAFGYWVYKPAPILKDAPFGRDDVTVIIPTVKPYGVEFEACLRSILNSGPNTVLVVTVGRKMLSKAKRTLKLMRSEGFPSKMAASAVPVPNKRLQLCHALPTVNTNITILADDSVYWPSQNFLPSVLAPFSDHHIGAVATKKRVYRNAPGEWSFPSILNFIACNYLQRHNWELRASNAIDSGVFVISGRTAAYRTSIFRHEGLLNKFCNERFFFGLFGAPQGLVPNDDNFLTRELTKQGYRTFFQDTEDATIVTTLGAWPKFLHQSVRWARTTFRSNPALLKNEEFWMDYPWTSFMVISASLFNFALVWDACMIASLIKSSDTTITHLVVLLVWMLCTKVVKVLPNLFRHPEDIPLMVFQVLYGYFHSFIKLWALLTFWDCTWSGRNLDTIKANCAGEKLDSSFVFI